MGPTSQDFFDVVHEQGGVVDPLFRQRVAAAYQSTFALDRLSATVREELMSGAPPGPSASMKKFRADVHGQRITELAADLAGPAAMLADDDSVGPLGAPAGEWPWAFLFARALTVGGGTSEVQRNILAEQVLGLPRDDDPTAKIAWRDAAALR